MGGVGCRAAGRGFISFWPGLGGRLGGGGQGSAKMKNDNNAAFQYYSYD